ncbi:hypothetical protein ScPMuIL_004811 [Solemya velum]
MLVCLCFRQKPDDIVLKTDMGSGSSAPSVGKAPTLYLYALSAPSRAVWMTAKAADIPVNIKYVDLFKGEHKTTEFAKINPDTTVPTLQDGHFALWECRPIMMYLVSKYGGSNPNLYPKNLQKRAVVDRMLNYDLGSVYKAVSEFMYPQLFQAKPPDPDKEMAMKKTFEYMDDQLQGCQYITGASLTIADISIAANISLTELKGYSLDPWTNLCAWFQRMKTLPFWAECNKGLYEWKPPA